MAPKSTRVIVSYHFLAEAVILFYCLFPFFHFMKGETPYLPYFYLMLMTTLIFLGMTFISKQVVSYMLLVPVIFLLGLLLNFSSLSSGVIALVLVWRFIALYREAYLGHELFYIEITTAVSLFYIIVFQAYPIAYYLVFLIFFMSSGYFLANYLKIAKPARQSTNLPEFIAKLIGLILGLFLFFYFIGRHILQVVWTYLFLPVWEFITNAFIALFVGLMYLLEKIPLPESDLKDNNNLFNTKTNSEDNQDVLQPETGGGDINYFYIALAILMTALLIYIFIKGFKKRIKKPDKEVEQPLEIHKEDLQDKDKDSFFKTFKKKFFNKPQHPVRKMIYQFEKRTKKKSLGRKQGETLQEWTKRIQAPMNTKVYEKVRYGGSEVSLEEKNELKTQINTWLNTIGKEE